MNTTIETRYRESLQNIPAPGEGCHPYLLVVANLGILSDISPGQIHSDIRGHIPAGRRKVLDREIRDAIVKAMSDRRFSSGGYNIPPKPEPIVQDGKATLTRIIEQSSITDEADLWESSPFRLMDSPKHDAALFLETLYHPDDFVWIGERHEAGIMGKTIRSVTAWIEYFENGGKTAPHIILNSLTGTPALTKGGDKDTYRGDGNIAEYRFCLVEFDNLSRADQIKFWCSVKLPIVALIDSGNKSIHGVIRVDNINADQWQTEIKNKLYNQFLVPLGVDGACSNPARLSRLPGHFRTEKKAYQKVLWLSSTPRSIGNV